MNKVTVRILGGEYTLKSNKKKEDILKIVSFVDDELNMLKQNLDGFSKNDVVILTCNNIAEKYFDALEKNNEQLEQIQRLLQDIEDKNKNIASLQLKLEQQDVKIQSLEMTDVSSKSLQNQIEKIKDEYEQKLKESEEISINLQEKFYEMQLKLAEQDILIKKYESEKNKEV